LNSRSNRSRGVIWLMSGAGPEGAGWLGLSCALTAPALAMSGAAGGPALLATLNTIAPMSTTHRAPATSQAVRSRAGVPAAAGAPTGRPQRWQKRARGLRSARQPAQVRTIRLAPQALQKFPAAGAPQAGHGVGLAVIGAEA
jgi:hypothetical protein